MAINNQYVIQLIGPRLTVIATRDLTEAQLLQALQEASQGKRNQLVKACSQEDRQRVGEILVDIIREKTKKLADARADAIIAEGFISFELLEKLL